MPPAQDLYAILGLRSRDIDLLPDGPANLQGTKAHKIRSAYRKKMQDLHPDTNPDPTVLEVAQDVAYAYEVLSDPDKRMRYDAGLDPEQAQSQSRNVLRLTATGFYENGEPVPPLRLIDRNLVYDGNINIDRVDVNAWGIRDIVSRNGNIDLVNSITNNITAETGNITSGLEEGDNTVVRGSLRASYGDIHIYSGTIEQDAIAPHGRVTQSHLSQVQGRIIDESGERQKFTASSAVPEPEQEDAFTSRQSGNDRRGTAEAGNASTGPGTEDYSVTTHSIENQQIRGELSLDGNLLFINSIISGALKATGHVTIRGNAQKTDVGGTVHAGGDIHISHNATKKSDRGPELNNNVISDTGNITMEFGKVMGATTAYDGNVVVGWGKMTRARADNGLVIDPHGCISTEKTDRNGTRVQWTPDDFFYGLSSAVRHFTTSVGTVIETDGIIDEITGTVTDASRIRMTTPDGRMLLASSQSGQVVSLNGSTLNNAIVSVRGLVDQRYPEDGWSSGQFVGMGDIDLSRQKDTRAFLQPRRRDRGGEGPKRDASSVDHAHALTVTSEGYFVDGSPVDMSVARQKTGIVWDGDIIVHNYTGYYMGAQIRSLHGSVEIHDSSITNQESGIPAVRAEKDIRVYNSSIYGDMKSDNGNVWLGRGTLLDQNFKITAKNGVITTAGPFPTTRIWGTLIDRNGRRIGNDGEWERGR